MNSNAATTVGLTLPANAWIVSRQSATDHRILPMMRTRGVSNDIYIGGSGSGTRIALFDSAYIGSDSAISTWPRMPMVFSIAQTSISTGVNLACTKTVKAITIENDEGVWSIGASCSAPVIRVYDCGTSAPANAACSGGTQLTTNTLSGTAGTVTDGTISSANVAAGHYMCAQIQAAGSCTTLYGQETLMARPQ
jgi:hypothetical protein